MNAKQIFKDWNQDWYYNEVYTKNGGKASDCIKCGKCEAACPQHLKITELLEEVVSIFERNNG
jgi:predicted aldo/keto reductase-like oxidoreductase